MRDRVTRRETHRAREPSGLCTSRLLSLKVISRIAKSLRSFLLEGLAQFRDTADHCTGDGACAGQETTYEQGDRAGVSGGFAA